MFILTTKDKLANAIRRAKELHPHVRVIRFGEYEVTGSTGNTYLVKCYRDEQNQKVVDCRCKTSNGIACKHAVAALPLHIHLAAQRMSRAAAH